TSGDLLADRRLAYALMVRGRGDAAAALSLIDEALERAPGWAEALFARAETLERLGRDTEAAQAYRACLARDPADRMGAGARLALLAGETPPALPEAYLRSLFDQYAPRYDAALLGRLGYRAPVLLRAAVGVVARPRLRDRARRRRLSRPRRLARGRRHRPGHDCRGPPQGPLRPPDRGRDWRLPGRPATALRPRRGRRRVRLSGSAGARARRRGARAGGGRPRRFHDAEGR